MTSVPTSAHPFRRAAGEVAWRCACGMSRNAAVHRGAARPAPPVEPSPPVEPEPRPEPAPELRPEPAPEPQLGPKRRPRARRTPPVTVSTSHLPAGEPVLTTDVVGSDFGLPLVRPTRTRQGSQVRVVRAHCRANGGVVVWFTDGTKTPPIHGRTAWVVAAPEPQQTDA